MHLRSQRPEPVKVRRHLHQEEPSGHRRSSTVDSLVDTPKADTVSHAQKCLLITEANTTWWPPTPFPSTRVSCYHLEDDLTRTSLNSAQDTAVMRGAVCRLSTKRQQSIMHWLRAARDESTVR
jgi:hypothetical protein